MKKFVFIFSALSFLGRVDAQTNEGVDLLSRPVDYTREKLEHVLQLREKAHRWEHIVRGFRKDHHFSLLTGYSSGEWQFQDFGGAVNEGHRSSGVEVKFRYAFHIPLYNSFGYFLGTSLGTQTERRVDSQVYVPSVVKFPGIVSGLVWNLSPVIRTRMGGEFYLERWENLGLETESYSRVETVSVTTRVSSFFVAIDIFFDLYYGVALEYASRRNFYLEPTKSGSQRVNADLEKQERVTSLAFTYHLM